MKLSEVHSELTLLGVNSPEVHALVDDLVLDIGPVPFWFRLVLKPRKIVKLPKKNVYQPHTVRKEVCGRLF